MIVICIDKNEASNCGECRVTFSIADGMVTMSAVQDKDVIEEVELDHEDVKLLGKIFNAINCTEYVEVEE